MGGGSAHPVDICMGVGTEKFVLKDRNGWGGWGLGRGGGSRSLKDAGLGNSLVSALTAEPNHLSYLEVHLNKSLPDLSVSKHSHYTTAALIIIVYT